MTYRTLYPVYRRKIGVRLKKHVLVEIVYILVLERCNSLSSHSWLKRSGGG